MKINKFKAISVAICCLLTSLGAEIHSAEEQRDERAGIINSFAGETAPNGWLLCDGKQYFSIDYPKLYEVIKTKYVPANEKLEFLEFNENSDNKKFRVPDLRGRVIVGVDNQRIHVTSNNTLGASGGEEKHQLLESELAPHVHLLKTIRGHAPAGNTNWFQVPHLDNPECKFDPHYSGSSGKGAAHNNMQPYTCLNYIINAGKNNNQQDFRQNEKIEQLEKKINQLVISQQGCAKAWVVFNGSNPNALNSYGVSSVVRNSIGDYTVNFLIPFSSQNYCVSLNAANGDTNPITLASGPFRIPQTQNNFRFITFLRSDGNYRDPLFVSACFYGNQ